MCISEKLAGTHQEGYKKASWYLKYWKDIDKAIIDDINLQELYTEG